MKLEKNFLIVSIAAALVIFGASVALTFRYGYSIGLPTGLAAFFVMITIMLILNARFQRSKKNKGKKKRKSKKNP